MSEQKALLYSAVLAQPYTAGQGHITVTAPTRGTAPTSGTFDVSIADPTTGNILLVFRVASVAGLVFTGAAESPDVNVPTGSLVYGTMLTPDALAQIQTDTLAAANYQVVDDHGTPVTGARALDFEGAGVVVSEVSGATVVTIAGAAAGGGTEIVAILELDNQTADVAPTNAYSVPAGKAGIYRVSVSVWITTPASVSSTLPLGALEWTLLAGAQDGLLYESSVVGTPNTTGHNQLSAAGVIEVDESTDIDVLTSGYASAGGTAMVFSLRAVVEFLGAVGGGGSGYDLIESNGTPVGPGNTIINFTGAGVVVTDSGGGVTEVAIAGGGGGGGFIQPLTAPVSGDFTPLNFNTGTGVTTVQQNNSSPVPSISLLQNDPSLTGQMAVLAQPKGNALFTFTIAFSFATYIDDSAAFLWLSDGGAGPNNITFLYQAGGANGLGIFSWSDFSSFVATILGSRLLVPSPSGPLIWLRVQETASARNYYISADGVLWMLLVTESNTAHFTTAQVGFGVFQNGSSVPGSMAITVYSSELTTP